MHSDTLVFNHVPNTCINTATVHNFFVTWLFFNYV